MQRGQAKGSELRPEQGTPAGLHQGGCRADNSVPTCMGGGWVGSVSTEHPDGHRGTETAPIGVGPTTCAPWWHLLQARKLHPLKNALDQCIQQLVPYNAKEPWRFSEGSKALRATKTTLISAGRDGRAPCARGVLYMPVSH